MNTPYVATDMVKIMEKLGQDKMLYWGFVSHTRNLLLDKVLIFEGAHTELRYSPGTVLLGHVS